MEAPGREPHCPSCEQPLADRGLVLVRREDDGLRACRSVWRCGNRHVWWRWVDRPDTALEFCPVPEQFGA